MLIATFNCNSVRRRLDAILSWLEFHKPDVLALQETKCQDADFPRSAFEDAGWRVVFRGQKKYNGVALISAEELQDIRYGFGRDDESEPRLITGRLGSVHVVNTYVPQGRSLDSDMFAFKLKWFDRLAKFFDRHFGASNSRVCWVGDLNVAPTPADVYDSARIWPHVCHGPEVVAAFQRTVSWGFEDVFRKHIQDTDVFTYWDYRLRGGVSSNRGWRIDHILATPNLAKHSTRCFVDIEPRRQPSPSDHTFVAAEFDL